MANLSITQRRKMKENMKILNLGQDMTTGQMFHLLDQGVARSRVREALKMPQVGFDMFVKMYEAGRAKNDEDMAECEVCGSWIYRYTRGNRKRWVCEHEDCLSELERLKAIEKVYYRKATREIERGKRHEAICEGQAQKVSG
ncbi:hypothetical protein [Jeotgalibacillus haloalkalitolerans]|uniref:Uncharacterized protein n=1 Tax=Jeotgalibacillus haloalkalitolerans TaxID=3104292 RepID=A0ABU5KKH5_9BACL|nr:hypothetical protein [Jeotgalibacillus sp. HH7-29]MDZ5711629.1 hypothetical protein [Jeotgalibacillus sp. HH7-29]